MLKKYRMALPCALMIIALITLWITSVPRWIGLGLLLLTALSLIFTSRGSFYFTKANKLLSRDSNKNMDKALELYSKADKLGVPDQYGYLIGTIFMQFGDVERGKAILDDIANGKDKKLVFQAKQSLSMYYWINKDIDSAISLCESARDMNLSDRNLYINLGTYYLAKGELAEFKSLQREAYQKRVDSFPLIDLEAEYLILNGDYERAGNFLTSLFNTKKPTFIDPYLHFAIVYMHYGEIEQAIGYLNDSLVSVTFSNVSLYSKNDVRKMVSILEDEDSKWGFVSSVLANPQAVISGNLPAIDNISAKPEFPPLPAFKAEEISPSDVKSDDEPDTSLNDDDEEWLKKHNY